MSTEFPLEDMPEADRLTLRKAIAEAETRRELIWITENGWRIASIVALALTPAYREAQ